MRRRPLSVDEYDRLSFDSNETEEIRGGRILKDRDGDEVARIYKPDEERWTEALKKGHAEIED